MLLIRKSESAIGIRKASDSILQAEERRVNYGDQKLVLGSLLEILNLKKE